MSKRELTDLDRGALAALDLLQRAYDTTEGEEEILDTMHSIRGAIASDGLPKVVRLQFDYERDFLASDDLPAAEFRGLYGGFPASLRPLMKGIPRTEWKGGKWAARDDTSGGVSW